MFSLIARRTEIKQDQDKLIQSSILDLPLDIKKIIASFLDLKSIESLIFSNKAFIPLKECYKVKQLEMIQPKLKLSLEILDELSKENFFFFKRDVETVKPLEADPINQYAYLEKNILNGLLFKKYTLLGDLCSKHPSQLQEADIQDYENKLLKIIHAGADVNGKVQAPDSEFDGYTPLMFAALKVNFIAARILIENGANSHLREIETLLNKNFGKNDPNYTKFIAECQKCYKFNFTSFLRGMFKLT